MVRAYPAGGAALLGGADEAGDLGRDFWGHASEGEVVLAHGPEWARPAAEFSGAGAARAAGYDGARRVALDDWMTGHMPPCRPRGGIGTEREGKGMSLVLEGVSKVYDGKTLSIRRDLTLERGHDERAAGPAACGATPR